MPEVNACELALTSYLGIATFVRTCTLNKVKQWQFRTLENQTF